MLSIRGPALCARGTTRSRCEDYVGSNNVNLLVPSGQFGTRLQGGKDPALALETGCLAKLCSESLVNRPSRFLGITIGEVGIVYYTM